MAYLDQETGVFYEDRSNKGFATLNPDHIRHFLMRLRKRLGQRKIRYFLCGEYGDQYARPHYHLCIFGIGPHWRDQIIGAWQDPDTKEPIGHVQITDLNLHRMQYTCGYVVKKLTKKTDQRLNGLYPEFVRHSIGIGRGSIEKIARALDCKSADLYYLTREDVPRTFHALGKQWPMDRYIREKILVYLNRLQHAKESGQKRFSKEMSRMSIRAQTDIPNKNASPSQEALLIFQYKAENAQRILNEEGRALIFMKAKEKLI